MAFALRDGARLSLIPLTRARSRRGRLRLTLRTAQSLPLHGLLTLHFDRRAFPPGAGSLLPGPLAAARTGLTPAGDDELQNESDHVFIGVTPPARWAYSRVAWNLGDDPR
jgi:hypothetical protein